MPDIVLTVHEGSAISFVVFDVKYRVSRAYVLDAMQSAHVYQDSLRIGARKPQATLLIVPRTASVAWLATPEFISAHRVGVHGLQVEGPTIPRVLSELLD